MNDAEPAGKPAWKKLSVNERELLPGLIEKRHQAVLNFVADDRRAEAESEE